MAAVSHPLLSAIVGVSLAIVVYDEVISVKSSPDDLLVAFLVDFLIHFLLVLYLIGGQACLARRTKRPQLRETCCARHGLRRDQDQSKSKAKSSVHDTGSIDR